MKTSTIGIAGVTAAAAVLASVLFYVPEWEDFRGPMWLGAPEQRAFKKIAEGLYQIDLPWHLTPVHQETLDLFLVKQKGGNNWYLSDAGGYDTWLHKHASILEAAVNATIAPDGKLSHVILTHGHLDHVGALPLMLKTFPDLKVVLHEAEEEFICGDRDYFGGAEPNSWQLNALKYLGLMPSKEFKMSQDRIIFMRGEEGTLASVGLPEMTFHHTPGHSPGHVVFLHSSGNLLGGDFADVLDINGTATLKNICGSSCDEAVGHRSICKIAHDLKWDRILPYHDAYKKGYNKEELVPLAEAYSHCSTMT